MGTAWALAPIRRAVHGYCVILPVCQGTTLR